MLGVPVSQPLALPVPGRIRAGSGARPLVNRAISVLAWLALAVWLAVTVSAILRFDFRFNRLLGDQASFLMQALSLAGDGHNLSFDERDLEQWRRAGWTGMPQGLEFRLYRHGWGFAKPYGYSAVLAPFISLAIVWKPYGGPLAAFLAVTFLFASYPYFYAYVIHSELFLALIVGLTWLLFLSYARSGRRAFLYGAFALMGFATSEKVFFLALFGPYACVAAWERGRPTRLICAAAFVAVFCLSALPYLHYSDYRSWHPYGGRRYFAGSSVPFAAGSPGGGFAFSPIGYVSTAEHLLQRVRDLRHIPPSAFYYVAGAHTGLLAFQPVALLLVLAALWRWRALDRLGLALLAGIVGYILAYLVILPTNYFGGGQSLGNRYFLQIAPSVLALIAAGALSRRLVTAAAVGGFVLALVFLWPHHRSPQKAFVRIQTKSWAQQYLPLERNQATVEYFICGREVCD